MSDKYLINQPKLNIIQRIRKNIVLAMINKKNYINLPDYLKNDFDVIDRMIEKDISAIEILPENVATTYINKNPEILETRFLEESNLVQNYVEKDPKLFNSLPSNSKLELVFIDEKYQFLKGLDEKTQFEVLTGSPTISIPILKQKVKSITSSCGNIINEEELPDNGVLVSLKIDSSFFGKYLNYFNDNVIYDAIKSNLEIVKSFDLTKLPLDTQINIARLDNSLLLKMDKNTINSFFENKRVTIKDISDLNINDANRLELINSLEIPVDMMQLMDCNLSKDLIQSLEDKIPENEYKLLLSQEIPEDVSKMRFLNVKNINNIISKFNREKVYDYLNDNQKNICSLVDELSNNFNDEQIMALLDKRELEMNFQEKNSNLNVEQIKNYLMDICERDKGLTKLKNYCDFRENNNGLDFCEGLLKSTDEYNKYGSLYNNLLENFQLLSNEEKREFENKWADLINLDNKFNIKNIQDFKKINDIEKDFYSKRVEHYIDDTSIKRDICEILVRNPNIYKITRLGNGTDYSMKNKSLEDVVDILSTLNEITDVESLRGIMRDCIEMIGSEELNTIRNIGRNIEEKIAHEYREGYTESFTNYDDMSDEELSKINGVSVQRINGVRVIELKGADFSFLSHTGAIDGGHYRCCCSLITNENFSTFGNSLINGGIQHIYSKFSPDRIKYINVGDTGFSDFKNTYISHDDLSLASKQSSSQMIDYNEVTLSTKNERGEEELKTNANIISSKYYDMSIVNEIANSENEPKTLYVLHEEIYNEKNKQYELKKEELTKEYIQTLDPKFLDLLLKEGTQDEDVKYKLIEIEKSIKEHIDDKFGKNILRKNLSRYWQLSRHKEGRPGFDVNYIQKELGQKLEQMDNDILKDSFRDKIKEVADDYGEER